MKKIGIKFLSILTLVFSVSLAVTSCGDDEPDGPAFVETDYVGTYYGAHLISDPTIVSIIQQIDTSGESDGSFKDTIIVSTGTDPNDKILEFTSALLNGATIQADMNKTTQNVIAKDFGDLDLGGEDFEVLIAAAKVKATSKIIASGGTTFNASLNLSGRIVSGEIDFPIGNLATTGTFTKE